MRTGICFWMPFGRAGCLARGEIVGGMRLWSRCVRWVRLFFVKALHFRENDNTAKTPRRQGAEEIFVVVAEALML